MKKAWLTSLATLCATAGLCGITAEFSTEAAEEPTAAASNKKAKKPKPPVDDKYRLALDVARDRAQVMHDLYSATLETMHHRYFHGSRAVVPARAMQDVFDSIQRQSKVEARWISVNTKPMSIDHAPESQFEKDAARAIVAGKDRHEAVEGGYYRRAGAIPLTGGCVGCHTGFFNGPNKTPRFAGLVISVPVRKGEKLSAQD